MKLALRIGVLAAAACVVAALIWQAGLVEHYSRGITLLFLLTVVLCLSVSRPILHRLITGLAERGQILAGGEPAAGAGDHDRADRRVAGILERRLKLPVQGLREGVELVGAVERDRLDGAVPRDLDLGHG